MMSPRARRTRIGGLLLAAALGTGAIALPASAASAEEPATPAPAAAPAAAGAGGYSVLIGGGIEPGDATSEAIIQEIVDLAKVHAKGKTPRIAIVTAGSEPAPDAIEASDGDEYDNATANGLYYGDWFKTHGVEIYAVPIDQNPTPDYPGDPYTAANASDPAVVAEIAKSDAVYFGGGDQSRYVRALMNCTGPDASILNVTSCTDTPALAAMRGLVDAGGVAAGSSAGLAIQQGPGMITGGEPYQSWRDGATPGSFDDDQLGYVPAGGFGFFSEGLIDSHFARRDRQPRIVRLALDLKQDRAFGVEENTALVVDRSARTGRVIGALGVSAFDLRETTFDGLNAAGISSSYVTAGSTIDFASGATVLAGQPTTAPGTAKPPAPATDIWGSYECEGDIFGTLNLAQALLASSASRAHGDTCVTKVEAPTLRVTFSRADTTEWNSAGGFTGLRMSIAGSPALSAKAKVTGLSGKGTLPTGSMAKITVTVTNTGAVPLGVIIATDTDNPLPEPVSSEAAPMAATANAATAADATPLLPGESRDIPVVRPVAAGAQTITLAAEGTPVSKSGADLEMDQVKATTQLSYTGVTATTPGNGNGNGNGGNNGNGTGGNTGNGDTGNGNAAPGAKSPLAQTGGAEPTLAFAGAGLLLVAAAVALAGAAVRRARRLSRP